MTSPKRRGGPATAQKTRIAAGAAQGKTVEIVSTVSRPCLFTFIVPVYATRAHEYFDVSRALKSVADQTVSDWEIIMLCDGSDPIMRDVFNGAHAEHGAKIRYYELPHRGIRGGHHMIDFGTDKAIGEFVCILNGDNWIEPEYVEKMYSANHDISTCWTEMHDLPGIILQGDAWKRGRIDRLCYAVRASIARRVTHEMHTDADHDYFTGCYDLAQSKHGVCRLNIVKERLGHHS